MIKRNTIIIGEIGVNANGDLGIVKQLIDICSDLNVPYIKLQKRDIRSCYTKEFLDSYRESPWGTLQVEQKEGLEFSLEQYKEIDNYCKEKGNIELIVSPWDLKSIDFLKDNFPDMKYLKIPSAKVTDMEFLKKCKESGFKLIVSTGMSTHTIIANALNALGGNECVRYLLGCTSSYPTPIEDTNLRQIKYLNHYFCSSDIRVGWSDHSGGILFPSMAVGLGAEMVEVHITLDRKMYGTDQASSLEIEGLRHLVKYIESLEKGMGGPMKTIMPSEIPIMKKLRG